MKSYTSVVCTFCSTPFLKLTTEIKRRGGRPFCSHRCYAQSNRGENNAAWNPATYINIHCSGCKVFFKQPLRQFKRAKNHYCSAVCYRKCAVGAVKYNWKGGFKAAQVRYHHNHIERSRERVNRNRARRRGAPGSFTREEWEARKKEFNYRCAHCCKLQPLTMDHIIPVTKGGTNYINNIQPLCRPCNTKKWNKLEDWFVGHLNMMFQLSLQSKEDLCLTITVP